MMTRPMPAHAVRYLDSLQPRTPFLTRLCGWLLATRAAKTRLCVRFFLPLVVIFAFAVELLDLTLQRITFRTVDAVLLRFAQCCITLAVMVLACAVIEMVLSPIFHQVVGW